MKVVVLLLLIANLVFFAWQYPQQQWIEGQQVSEMSGAEVAGENVAVAPSLMMLKELPPTIAAKVVTVNADKATSAVLTKKKNGQNATTDPVCWSLGPFADARLADRGLKILTAQSIKGRVNERKSRALVGYRVQLPEQGSKAAAQGTMRSLRGRGVKDVAILADKGRYFVSLGFFSKSSSARTRSAAVRKLGYKPLTEKVFRSEGGYWLDLYSATDKARLDKAWVTLSRAYPKVRRETRDCPKE